MRSSHKKEWSQLEVVARIEQINLTTGEVTAVNEYSRYGFPTNIIGESSDSFLLVASNEFSRPFGDLHALDVITIHHKWKNTTYSKRRFK